MRNGDRKPHCHIRKVPYRKCLWTGEKDETRKLHGERFYNAFDKWRQETW